MFGSWIVESVIRFSSNGVAVMERTASATNAAAIAQARLTGHITAQEAAFLRQGVAAEKAAKSVQKWHMTLAGVGAAVGVIGIAAGLKQAAEFQRAMVGLNIPTFNAAPEGMRRMVLDVSGRTAQDPTMIAAEAAAVAKSGINDPNRLLKVFTRFAEAADVLQLSKGVNPVDTVTKLTQFSHIFGVYQGKRFNDMVESAMKMQQIQPEGLDKMLTQGRQFIGQAMARGVPMEDIFKIYAEMGQTGYLAGRGGSGVKSVLQYLGGAESLTDHMSAVRKAAFQDMSGLGASHGMGAMFDAQGKLKFYDKEGNLHLSAAVKYLAQLSGYMNADGKKGQFANDITNAFGQAGANFLLPILRPEAQKQFGAIDVSWAKIPSIQTQFSMYIDTFMGSLQQMTTNFKRVVIDIFTPMMPEFTRTFQAISGVFVNFAHYLESHHDAARIIGNVILGITAALTALTGILAVRMLIAGPAMAASATSIAASATAIAASLGRLATAMDVEGASIATGSVAASGGLASLASGIFAFVGRLSLIALGGALLTDGGVARNSDDAKNTIISNYGQGYFNYLKSRHKNDFTIQDGDLTPHDWKVLSQKGALSNIERDLKKIPSGASGQTVIHNLTLHFPNATNQEEIKKALQGFFKNPRSAMGRGAPGSTTHANIPLPLTILGNQ